jgi:hypothetical protein
MRNTADVTGSKPIAVLLQSISGVRHVMRRDESHITKRVMSVNVNGHPRRGRPKKRGMDCVKDDMRIKGVSTEMTTDRREWKKKTCCADPT